MENSLNEIIGAGDGMVLSGKMYRMLAIIFARRKKKLNQKPVTERERASKQTFKQ